MVLNYPPYIEISGKLKVKLTAHNFIMMNPQVTEALPWPAHNSIKGGSVGQIRLDL